MGRRWVVPVMVLIPHSNVPSLKQTRMGVVTANVDDMLPSSVKSYTLYDSDAKIIAVLMIVGH
jgi:hypothetical protein